jgi:hypothetical protein
MEFILINQDSPEWNHIWGYLETHPLNEGLAEPKSAENQGYSWEYIGSYKQGDRIIHELKHFCHPSTQGPVKTSLAASSEFTDEQIAKTFRIK